PKGAVSYVVVDGAGEFLIVRSVQQVSIKKRGGTPPTYFGRSPKYGVNLLILLASSEKLTERACPVFLGRSPKNIT
ncbi:hypothetical protein Q5V95_20500, partial [Acinetobacter baumannii]|uniref:hypothetical protein n=1 Tax=Acinetobacter baumannii TaxID=470 RepID=UPI00270952C5